MEAKEGGGAVSKSFTTHRKIRKWLVGLTLTGFGFGVVTRMELNWGIWLIIVGLSMISILICVWGITNILDELEANK